MTARAISYCLLLIVATASAFTHSTARLFEARYALAATSVGNLALFGGGLTATVDIFDSSSNSWTTARLSQPRSYLTATSVANFALFAGGITEGGVSNVVDIFDSSSNSWTTAMLSQPRAYLGSTSIGQKAFFIGGAYNVSNGALSNAVDIFDANTKSWSTTTMRNRRVVYSAATSVGDLVLIWGYTENLPNSPVEIYNVKSNLWVTNWNWKQDGTLYCTVATSVGEFAIFAGCQSSSGKTNSVHIFDSSSYEWSKATLSQEYDLPAAVSVGNKIALIGGGSNPQIDMFNLSSNSWSTVPLSETRSSMAATSVGNLALFGGGYYASDVVDIYEFQELSLGMQLSPVNALIVALLLFLIAY